MMSVGGLGLLVVAIVAVLILGRSDQVGPAAAAMAGCWIAAVIALEPVRLASRHGLQRVAMAVLASFVLRLGLAIVAVAVLVMVASLPVVSVALWAMLWYLALLAIEMTIIYQYFGACTARVTAPASQVLQPR